MSESMNLYEATNLIEKVLRERSFVFLDEILNGNYDGLRNELDTWYRENGEKLGIEKRVSNKDGRIAYRRVVEPTGPRTLYSDATGLVHSSSSTAMASSEDLAKDSRQNWEYS